MPRRRTAKYDTILVNEYSTVKVEHETEKALKIKIKFPESEVFEEWIPKSQIFQVITQESEEIFEVDRLTSTSILNLKDKLIKRITYKDWLTSNKRGLSAIMAYFDVFETDFLRNMREADQFWEGGRFAFCQICGKTLTNEISVEHGIGPICAGHVNQNFERSVAEQIMNNYRMVYEGQFDGLDQRAKIWVAYRFKRINRKSPVSVSDSQTTVRELRSMYQHAARGKVSNLRWELILEHNQREPTWVTIQNELREQRKRRAENPDETDEIVIEIE